MTSPVRRIIIVDDHDAIRRGVRQLLETKPYYDVVGEASDGRAGLELATVHRAAVGGNLVKPRGQQFRPAWSARIRIPSPTG